MKAFALALLSLSVFSASLLSASWQAQTLRQAAERSGLLVSTAVRAAQLAEPAYASTLAREFNMLEPEDAMKWWVLRPDARSYDFRQGDELVRFALEHGMKVRGHCLVWGRTNPEWLTQGHFTTRQL
ncbi:MAG: endo-1,4-beta-xylanase, partial [Candidatus Sulfotelmatobacter sp.]